VEAAGVEAELAAEASAQEDVVVRESVTTLVRDVEDRTALTEMEA
jgi:hypothetical protein